MKRHRGPLLVLPIFLAGCASFYDEISLNADGSGSYHLTLYVKMTEAKENIENLRLAVRDRAAKTAAAAGFTLTSVDLKRDGPLRRIEVKADFPNLSVFASPALAVSKDSSEWSFVVPRNITFQGGRLVARVLRESAPPKDHPIRVSFPGREGRFTVHFPGEVVESTGKREERLASWNFPLAQLCDEPVEMAAACRPSIPYGLIAFGAALVAALAVLLVQAFRKRSVA